MPSPVPFSNRPNGRSPFDSIRHVDEDQEQGEFEWWSAREAMPHLGYANWQNMQNVIRKAKSACRNAKQQVVSHFIDISKTPSQGGPRQADTQMTRFGMYLLAMCGDPDKPEIAAAQAYFAIQTRRAETELPPPEQPRPASPPPAIPRPWSQRMRDTIMDHRRHIIKHLPKGAFSVYTGTIPDILTLEDVLLDHLLPLLQGDGPDNSIGQRWSKFREGQSWAGRVHLAPLYMPASELSVEVYVYLAGEWPHFRDWLESVYLPENLPEYLCRKFPARTFGLAPPSAADHTCQRLTGTAAKLLPPVRARLISLGGFVPYGQEQQLIEASEPSLFRDQ